jgi:hypothetical protein
VLVALISISQLAKMEFVLRDVLHVMQLKPNVMVPPVPCLEHALLNYAVLHLDKEIMPVVLYCLFALVVFVNQVALLLHVVERSAILHQAILALVNVFLSSYALPPKVFVVTLDLPLKIV